MKLYIAFGTVDFLKKLREKYKNEKMIEFYNNETAILIHETARKSVFAAPRKYEVVIGSGELDRGAIAVLTYVPITDEGKPLFEYNLTTNKNLLENANGITAFRVLRPIKSDTYVVMSIWEKEMSYKKWTQSSAYEKYEELINNTKAGLQKTIFSGPWYTKIFYELQDH
ncbi:antibiotic biosynthesis monooxygenase family protein [Fredinandcohnia humi]